jgi:hypothetical protein
MAVYFEKKNTKVFFFENQEVSRINRNKLKIVNCWKGTFLRGNNASHMVHIQTNIRSYLLRVFHILELSTLHEMLANILQINLVHDIIRVCPKFYITRLY